MINFKQLKSKLQSAREVYKPERIKYLLVAEAAPDTLDRFFYYLDVFKHDDLFLGISNVLFPNLKEQHLIKRRLRNSSVKQLILEQFKKEGFYLLDLSELPVSILSGSLSTQVPSLIKRLKQVASHDTQIILIKATVYDAAFLALKSEGIVNLIDQRIPFPGSGQQAKFNEAFLAALQKAKYRHI